MSLPLDKALALEKQYRFQWEPAQKRHVLLYPEGLIQLTESAGEILKRIDGNASAEDIVESLEQAFPGADLKQDVIDFLEVAHDKGWIRVN
ncbi:MAG: pyrroloquinoline quinone biosynthesis peptide chaperone PqqD [Gammaproteobacteria bacterium]|nr:pyrroloquinoline quinone biosynthesis peptide chaperone PqqD [Gammaproteobacteria bacterium]MDP2140681.1 pyrroloquinoline quinone biosynthesis peptide chaperone PqqD [Gammaproteobacteria bacterium]MDP2346940.1 pyrroloquinoline quinone biosynthesis peptide chaperone PqqD [Gammaproteobacteria bacterium]